MESQKIKENRRAKFLAKMEKNKTTKKEIKKTKPKEDPKSITKDNTVNTSSNNLQQSQQPSSTNNENNNKDINNIINNINNNMDLKTIINNINSINSLLNPNIKKNNNEDNNIKDNIKESTNKINNNITNNNNNKNNNNIPDNNKENDKNNNNIKKDLNKTQTQNEPKIDYKEIMEKIEKYNNMISIQNFIKKILILILSIIHCLKYSPLNDHTTVKYTLIILEISSIFFNKYFNDKKRNLTSKNNIYQPNLNNTNGKDPLEIKQLFKFLMNNSGIFNQLFFIINTIKDIISDIGILFFINIMFFLMNRKEKLKI